MECVDGATAQLEQEHIMKYLEVKMSNSLNMF